MKRIITLIALVIAAGPLLAQFTITRADFPDIGDSQYYTVSDTGGIDVGTPGTGQSWDFSGAINTGSTITVSWKAASDHPKSGSFPGATHVQQIGPPAGDYWFWKIDNDSAVVYGEKSLTNQALPYDAPQPKMWAFPSMFGNPSIIANCSGVYADGFITNVTRNGSYVSEVDATGSLITPFATYPNVIRKKTQGMFSDSSWTGAADSDVIYLRYDWYAQGRKLPVFVFEFESVVLNGGNATESFAIWYADSSLVGIENPLAANMTVFPNPSTGNANVKYTLDATQDVTVAVLNVMGENVMQVTNETQIAGDHVLSIPTERLSKGLYFVELRAGEVSQTRKLILQ